MKKRWIALALSVALTVVNGMTAFAGQWETAGGDWKYKNDDGTYSTNTWQWIDGKSYYFDSDSIMAKNTTIDGYMLNADGQWTVDGVVQTQGTGNAGNSSVNGVQHSAGYDPAHPLAHKIDEFGLRLPEMFLTGNYAGGSNNVQALLTNQIDQYYIAPVTDPGWTTEADYYETVQNTQLVYEWFCNWLNGMDWENMSEMQRAQEIEKVLGGCSYDRETADNGVTTIDKDSFVRVLIDKKGVCSEFALVGCALAKTLGLKSGISGTGNHTIYYIEADGNVYLGSNQILDLRYPKTGIVGLQ